MQHRLARLVLADTFTSSPRPRRGGSAIAPGLFGHVRLNIEQTKDAFRAGQSALQVGPHHRDLRDGLVEPLHIGNEGDDQAQ